MFGKALYNWTIESRIVNVHSYVSSNLKGISCIGGAGKEGKSFFFRLWKNNDPSLSIR